MPGGFEVGVVRGDIREAPGRLTEPAGLILCWGDTLTHLNDLTEVRTLLFGFGGMLDTGGSLVLSFRDYTTAIDGNARFIPVKSDRNRILTCFLEYHDNSVVVTDLLHEWVDSKWIQRAMSYRKVRLDPKVIVEILREGGLHIVVNRTVSGHVTLVASKL